MGNSRADLTPTNSSRGRGLPIEVQYRPGFVDNRNLEDIKMTIDKELAQISHAFYQTTERVVGILDRLDKLEASGQTESLNDIVAVFPLGSNGSFTCGVKDFPRKISVQCSVASGYYSDQPSRINVYVNKVRLGSVESTAHEDPSGQVVSLTNYGVLSAEVGSGEACEVSVSSDLGAGGSTSAWVVVNKID